MPVLRTLALLLALAPFASLAQQSKDADRAALVSGVRDVLLSAPDPHVDTLFQAVHASARKPGEVGALCAWLEPDADRSLDGLNAFAARLGEDSRARFSNAITNVLIAGWQGGGRRFDEAGAMQVLKENATRTAFLHDGFIEGLQAGGRDAKSRDARCRSLRWMLDTLQSRPQAERAQVTRLLLSEGLQRLAP